MLSQTTVRSLIALLIGFASITAGVLTWRASQINSAASYDDRVAVGQTITLAQRRIAATVEVSAQAAGYDAYTQQYEAAAALPAPEAAGARDAAAARAIEIGVFSPLANASNPDQMLSFNVDERIASVRAAQDTGLESGGPLEPARFGSAADDIRTRVRGLQIWTLVVLASIGALTLAEVADTKRVRRSAALAGAAILLTGLIAALTKDFF